MTDSAAAWLREEGARLGNTWESRHRWATRRAWLRASLDRHLFRYNYEHCQRCGRRVGLSWWSVTGWTHVVRDGGCLRCIRCFDREAWTAGSPVCWIAVSFEEFDQRVGRCFDDQRAGRVK